MKTTPFQNLPRRLQAGIILKYAGLLINPILCFPAIIILSAIAFSGQSRIPPITPIIVFLIWYAILAAWVWTVECRINPALRRHLAGRPGSQASNLFNSETLPFY